VFKRERQTIKRGSNSGAGRDRRQASVESRYDDLLSKAIRRREYEKKFGRAD